MLVSLTLGAGLVLVNFLIHAAGLAVLGLVPRRAERSDPRYLLQTFLMLLMVLGMFVLIMVEVAVWAGAFRALGFFADFEEALYFSTSTFATVGFMDVTPAHHWRLLAAIEGIAGFLIIGWSSAFLVAAAVRVGPFRRELHF